MRARRAPTPRIGALPFAAAALAACCAHAAPGVVDDAAPLSGDLGAGAWRVQGTAPGQHDRTRAVPYLYADAGRFFAREDTFGAKLLPLGWGALELVARVSSEGADSAGPGVASRRNPRPLGIGTFQETPWGGVFLDAFDDTASGGTLFEASYAAELDLGPVALYPQAGLARRGARYVDHLYGVSAADARATGMRPYAGGAALTTTLGVAAEWTLAAHWALVAHVQRDAFDHAIADSPRVGRAGQGSALVALAYRFD